jgi:hypothetical protein
MINKISVTTKSNKKHIMNIETYARWLCLLESMHYISENAKKNKINLEKSSKWIKPLAIQKYVKERFPSMLHDFKTEEHLYIDPNLLIKIQEDQLNHNLDHHQFHTK